MYLYYLTLRLVKSTIYRKVYQYQVYSLLQLYNLLYILSNGWIYPPESVRSANTRARLNVTRPHYTAHRVTDVTMLS